MLFASVTMPPRKNRHFRAAITRESPVTHLSLPEEAISPIAPITCSSNEKANTAAIWRTSFGPSESRDRRTLAGMFQIRADADIRPSFGPVTLLLPTEGNRSDVVHDHADVTPKTPGAYRS